MNNFDFTNITGVGVAGLAVFLLWRLAANHIDHNTEVLDELREVIKELTQFLKQK